MFVWICIGIRMTHMTCHLSQHSQFHTLSIQQHCYQFNSMKPLLRGNVSASFRRPDSGLAAEFAAEWGEKQSSDWHKLTKRGKASEFGFQFPVVASLGIIIYWIFQAFRVDLFFRRLNEEHIPADANESLIMTGWWHMVAYPSRKYQSMLISFFFRDERTIHALKPSAKHRRHI